MTIKEMHYDLKQKLNKIDSQQYANLKVPEIDFKLNEALELYIKRVAEPRDPKSVFGFETTQRTIDDIRALVVNQNMSGNTCLSATLYDSNTGSYTVDIPQDYMFYISSHAIATKNSCLNKELRVRVKQHDDEFRYSPFDKSSFEWRFVNLTFFGNKLRIYTDGTFSINNLCLNYIKKHPYIHNAAGYPGGQYRHLGTNVMLTGTQDCLLAEHTHREIVDLAVLIISGDLESPNYQIKQNKLNIDN